MRVIAMVAMILFVAPTVAQVDVLDDPAGDVEAYAQGTPTGAVSPGSSAVDLRLLSIDEDVETLFFTITVEGFDDPEFNVNFEITFKRGAEEYLIDVYGLLEGPAPDLTGYLLRAAGPGFERITQLDVDIDTGSKVTVMVPRHALMDQHGMTPAIGHDLTDIRVLSRGSETAYTLSNDGVVGWRDFMPDDGEGAVFASRIGLQQSGAARLASAEPMRYSNGEATTFVYTIEAYNDGDDELRLRLQAYDVPDGWQVYFPDDELAIPADSSVTADVVLQTRFQHAHGDAATFRVEATDDQGDTGRVELGIRYPDIPQPGGHHARLWLHSQAQETDAFSAVSFAMYEAFGAGEQGLVYMNTVEDDVLSDDVAVPGPWCDTLWSEAPEPAPIGGDSVPHAAVYCWAIPLSPTLRVGLDFDLEGTGRIEVPVKALAPADRSWLGGHVIYLPPGTSAVAIELNEASPPAGAIILANVTSDGEVSFAADSLQTLTADIIPRQESDLVPYQRGGSLWLWLNATMVRPETVIGPKTDKPAIEPGGVIDLPLIDYADPVAAITGGQGRLLLDATTPHRQVNPGETVVFNVSLESMVDGSVPVALQVIGTHHEWANIVGGNRIRLEANERMSLQFAVTAPRDAADGERADLILEATHAEDVATRALVRLVVEVDTDTDHADESAVLEVPGKASPGVLPWLLAPAAWWARRRRDP